MVTSLCQYLRVLPNLIDAYEKFSETRFFRGIRFKQIWNSLSGPSCHWHPEEQGMSGGQQNKDEEVVKMVARMNELKEKQDVGQLGRHRAFGIWKTGELGRWEYNVITYIRTNDI